MPAGHATVDQSDPQRRRRCARLRLARGAAARYGCRRAGIQVVEVVTAAGIELAQARSEEHTSELQSLMRISYAVFCLKKKKITKCINTYMIINNHMNS